MQPSPVAVEAAPKTNQTPYILLAAGCGVLFLLSLCCVPGAAFYAYQTAEEPEPVLVDWEPPVEPAQEPRPLGPPPAPVSPTDPNVPAFRTVVVQITEAQGLSSPAVGSQCSFQVERRSRRDGTFWCHTAIVCGGRALFGNEQMGYFDCTLYEGAQRHVVGEDTETTAASRDPAFRIDTLNEQFEIRDDATGANGAFVLRGRVLGVD